MKEKTKAPAAEAAAAEGDKALNRHQRRRLRRMKRLNTPYRNDVQHSPRVSLNAPVEIGEFVTFKIHRGHRPRGFR